MAKAGSKSKGGFDFERGIHATLQNQIPSDPVPCDQEWLCSPVKKQGLKRSIVGSHKQVGSGRNGSTVLSDLLQPTFSGPKTQQEMEAYFGPLPTKPVFATGHFQDGNTGNNQVVSPKRGMGNFAGFQRCLFPHPH